MKSFFKTWLISTSIIFAITFAVVVVACVIPGLIAGCLPLAAVAWLMSSRDESDAETLARAE